MSRESKKLIQEVSKQNAEQAFADYNSALAQLQIIDGKLNKEITASKAKYENQINLLQAVKDENFEMLQVYAQENEQLFVGKKSVEWTQGRFGFRTGTPKLTLRKGYRWPAVLELVKEKMRDFVRVKEDVDKEALIANRDSVDLKSVGVEVVQDESFFVEPNLEVLSN